jgi:hypothetical protein
MRVCVVDYACPQYTADWIHANAPRERVLCERVRGEGVFNKCAAHNRGARAAIERWGAEQQLCFIDADTLVTRELWLWIEQNVDAERFYFVEGSTEYMDLTGLLIVSATDFERSGGFDEGFRGWGAEDLDMRLRLHYKVGLPFEEIPAGLAQALPHDDCTRTLHYDIKDKWQSHIPNLERLIKNFERWTGRDLAQERGPEIAKLLGVYGVRPE